MREMWYRKYHDYMHMQEDGDQDRKARIIYHLDTEGYLISRSDFFGKVPQVSLETFWNIKNGNVKLSTNNGKYHNSIKL